MCSGIKKVLVTLLTSTLLTGCSIGLSPDQLIKPPKLTDHHQEMVRAAEQFLPEGAILTIPTKPQKANAFELVDINSDGTDELIIFYKKTDFTNEVGVLILEKNNTQWQLIDRITEIAPGIDYAAFHNLTGNKKKELVLGLSGYDSFYNDLIVYSFKNKKTEKLLQKSCVNFSVGQLSDNTKEDIAVIYQEDGEALFSTVLELYQFTDSNLNRAESIKYEGLYPYSVQIGNVAKNQLGIFMDFGVGAHSSFTQLLLWENGQLKNIFPEQGDDSSITFKAYLLPCKDVNNDGIIEIGIMQEPPGNNYCMAEMPWINMWYKWNGQNGLTPVLEEYTEYFEGYTLSIPHEWHGKYTIKRIEDKNGEKQGVNFLYIDKNNKPIRSLLSIQHIPKEDWPHYKLPKNTAHTILAENGQNVLVGFWPTTTGSLKGTALKEYQKVKLDPQNINKIFKMNQ